MATLNESGASAPVEAEEFRWEPIEPNTIEPGMYVRGVDEEGGDVEGEVSENRLDERRLKLTGAEHVPWAYLWRSRTWTRRVPAAHATGRWDSVTPDLLSIGDRVRVTHQRDAGATNEGEVVALRCSMVQPVDATPGRAVQVMASGGIRFCAHSDTWNFFKWVVEATVPAFTWTTLTHPVTLRPGDHVRGTLEGAATPVAEGEFERLTATGRIKLVGQAQAWNPESSRVWEVRSQVGTTQPVPTPTPEYTWVDVDTLLLTEGDRARWRHSTEAEWHEVTVREVDSDGDVYPEGTRGYITGSRLRVWQRRVAARVQADGPPIPDWATSLDAARRHVHARARQLFVSRDNCASGTQDFLTAAGLPDLRRDYPAPPDESAEIQAFLTTVREAAITTANRHGKSMSQVQTWLRREGITEPTPPPVQYTVTVTAPAGTTLDEVRRLGNIRDGWEVR